ncbi:hypothetical protein, partial [Burkholderia cepacia]|uniref:hypothetical protein n=1 Tax=Burkholderia cepacia TaxID=292 RepID=UPI00157697B7|nr:hypothetical protein [Burkholderia cepacia]
GGIHTGISARAGFRACSRFQSGVDTRRHRIGARHFPTRRYDAGTGRACARAHRICPRIGIGALELGTRACRGQSCRLVRTVRRERTGRQLTGHPYRRARP